MPNEQEVGPKSKKVHRHFIFLVEDKSSPGGVKLSVLTFEYKDQAEMQKLNDKFAEREFIRKFPDDEARHIETRDEQVLDDGTEL